MPKAICPYGHLMHYRNQRGFRLAALRCETCGMELKRAVWDSAKRQWIPLVRKSKQVGRSRHNCWICGRARYCPSSGSRIVEEPFKIKVLDPARDAPLNYNNYLEVPSGVVICWLHSEHTPVINALAWQKFKAQALQ